VSEDRTARCHLCEQRFPYSVILDHLRIEHPGMYEPVMLWPDGSPVILEDLTPEDFA
jgi:hypothetical protein